MEHFDVLNCTGRKTGEIVSRDEAHRIGTWHGAFHCLIVFERDGRKYALFQKRAAKKKIAPGKFDVSVGGHYASGEDARLAGPREIREELGINVPFNELLPLGRRIFVYCFSPGVREYEFQDIFLLHRIIQSESLTLQPEEVDGVIEMDIEEGIALLSGKAHRMELSLHTNKGSQENVSVTADGFVPCLDNYYLKLLLLARRYFNGERQALVI